MNRLRDALAYCLGLLRGSGDDEDGSGLHGEGARRAQERRHFWAEFREGQRQAEERSRAPR